MPCIDFVHEATHCPSCGSDLRVRKTRRRPIITLAQGPFEAREVVKQCVARDCAQILRSKAMPRLVKQRQRYGYDLIVHVGLARYLAGQQREEIRSELRERLGIDLSTGTLSELCDRFLVALECLHLLRTPYLRAAMQDGYPLHIDATCDRGKGGLFVCLDGWRGWVLMATRIDTERDIHLRPLVDQTIDLFGDPVAIVRDLGEAGSGAVVHLRERGIVDLACHFHFLAAVGKNLIDKPYVSLRGLLRTSRLRSDLCSLLRELRRYGTLDSHDGRFGPGRVREELLALVLWILEGDGHKDAAYPFALPHLAFVRRCQQALTQADQWVPCPRSTPERRAIRHLQGRAARIDRDPRFAQTVKELDRGCKALSELRDVLRLCHDQTSRATEREQPSLPALELRRLQEIENAVFDYRQKLERQLAAMTKAEGKVCPETVILRYLKRYGPYLFWHPALRDEHGAILAVVDRTNNVLETLFGRAKQRLRRRLGRAHLGHDLEQQPPQAMLTANLKHPEYVRVLCGSLDHLPEAFADLDAHLTAQPQLQRNNRDFKLLRRVRSLLDAPPGSSGDSAVPTPSSATATVV